MKTKIKRPGSTELPRFIVGALATAGASTASGATVQISFANNVLSSATGGWTNFVADLTGDNTPELQGQASAAYVAVIGASVRVGAAFEANTYSGELRMYASVEGRNVVVAPGDVERRRAVPFTFSDTTIGAGAIAGWLDVTAYASAGLKTIQIHRLIFDDASTTAPSEVDLDAAYPEFVAAVPEPGSNLALLALGAGGLTLRRRLKRAA